MTDDQLFLEASALFRENFGEQPSHSVFAPGRVNLIGEHTDYNNGFVLPFALPYKTVVVGSRSTSPQSRVYSTMMPSDSEGLSFVIDGNLQKGGEAWSNYVKGTIYQYLSDLPKGFSINAVIHSNVPLGSGLSSSAALEVAVATLLEKMCNLSVDGVTKALRCQKAEHTFVGLPCGIMDQFISAMGKEGNLLLIDCRSNTFELVPFGAGEDAPVVLVTNSKVKHVLTGSEYPDRVRQCKEAVAVLQKRFPHIQSLRDADMASLEAVKKDLSDVSYRRARHVIGEDARTLRTVQALKKNDYVIAGQNMTQSHTSMRDDYEISCPELDYLVELALQVPGVYGSRMTGGGFGGCTVTLVKRSSLKQLEELLKKKYFERFGFQCECYETTPSAGAGLLESGKQPAIPKFRAMLPIAVVALSVSLAFIFALRRK